MNILLFVAFSGACIAVIALISALESAKRDVKKLKADISGNAEELIKTRQDLQRLREIEDEFVGRIGQYERRVNGHIQAAQVRCVATYKIKDAVYCVVENIAQPTATRYAMMCQKIAWNDAI
jgi:hypothetical protein